MQKCHKVFLHIFPFQNILHLFPSLLGFFMHSLINSPYLLSIYISIQFYLTSIAGCCVFVSYREGSQGPRPSISENCWGGGGQSLGDMSPKKLTPSLTSIAGRYVPFLPIPLSYCNLNSCVHHPPRSLWLRWPVGLTFKEMDRRRE